MKSKYVSYIKSSSHRNTVQDSSGLSYTLIVVIKKKQLNLQNTVAELSMSLQQWCH